MTALSAMRLNDRATEDVALHFSGLRDDQMLYVHPCQTLPVAAIMDAHGGRRTVHPGDITDPAIIRLRNPSMDNPGVQP